MPPPRLSTGLPEVLDDLLDRLHRRGLALGPLEVIRLRHLLALPDALSGERLPGLLMAVLCKDAPCRDQLAREVQDWQRDWDARLGGPAPSAPDQGAPGLPATATPATPAGATGAGPATAPGPARPGRALLASAARHRRALVPALLAATLAVGWWLWPPPPAPPQPLPATAAAPAPNGPLCPQDLPTVPVTEVWAWVPVPDPGPWLGLAGALLLAGLIGVALWRLTRAPRWLPKERQDAAPRQVPPPFSLPGDLLLAPAQRRELVWSIDRYLSDEPEQALDPVATVAASARAAGAPTLVPRRRTFPRQVWLWCDRKATQPALQGQLVREVRRALEQANLPLRTAHFFGLPTRLTWDDNGEPFAPACQEGAGAEALVAVLTDGLAWAEAWARPGERPAVERLARELRGWPRLVLVDLGDGDLTRLAAGWGLATRPADGLAGWLAGRRDDIASSPWLDRAQLDLWAAACLLGPHRPDLPEAEHLRRGLQLALPPFAHRALRERLADCDADPDLARRLLRRLLDVPHRDARGLPEGDSYLARAVAAWDERLAAAAGALADGDPDAAARVALERACLQLLVRPVAASAALAQLAVGGRNRALIRARLARYTPDAGASAPADAGPLPLGWRWRALPVQVRYRLRRLGLGDLPKNAVHARPAARHHLALGLLAVVAGAVLASAVQRLTDHDGGPGPFADPRFQAQVLALRGATRTWLGSPWHLTALPGAGPLATPHTWRYQPIENPAPLAPRAALLAAGTRALPLRPCTADWPRRVLAVIAADPTNEAARALALRLLDRGGVDRLLLAADWPAHLEALTQGVRVPADGGRPGDQLLLVLPADGAPPDPALAARFDALAWVRGEPLALAQALDFGGVRPVTDPWPAARVLVGRPVIAGGPAMETDRFGVTWVRVCGGTFLMGSPDSEEGNVERYAQQWAEVLGGQPEDQRDDVRRWLATERPRHPVLLEPFDIARTELTNGQRRAAGADASGDGALPVADLDHTQATQACEALGGVLPSEAQWEFAARAGTATRWSFGDEEAALGDHAWFRGNSGMAAHPVGEKPPNDLCLADLHGNVYEWTADCYDGDNYVTRGPLTVEPDDNRSSCGARVVRGGSFADPPFYLRSAVRFDARPGDRVALLGLRCVRSVPRQQ